MFLATAVLVVKLIGRDNSDGRKSKTYENGFGMPNCRNPHETGEEKTQQAKTQEKMDISGHVRHQNLE